MTLQDWGIKYDEIEPYFDKFEKMGAILGEESPLGPKRRRAVNFMPKFYKSLLNLKFNCSLVTISAVCSACSY